MLIFAGHGNSRGKQQPNLGCHGSRIGPFFGVILLNVLVKVMLISSPCIITTLVFPPPPKK